MRLIDRRYRFTHHDRFSYFDRRAVSEPTKMVESGLVTDNSFLDDVAEGTLPAVSWIDPNFIDLSVFEHGSNDDHPPSDVEAGQRLVFAVYNALAEQAELWEKTLLIVTYDEHGGFYDHVEPPPAEDDDPRFHRYGVRVPALLASPLVRPGKACSVQFDHASIIKTILQLFCRDEAGSIPDMGRRVSVANDLGVALRASGLAAPPSRDGLAAEIAERRAGALKARLAAPAPQRKQTNSVERELAATGDLRTGKVRRSKRLPSGRP